MTDLTARVGGLGVRQIMAVSLVGSSGVWTDITPAGISLDSEYNGSNFGALGIAVDPTLQNVLYASFHQHGIWRSTDYGATWTGPIDDGNAITFVGITMGQDGVLYGSGIGSASLGFWRSTNQGVTWTNYNVAPLPSERQDCYAPQVDPYDPLHLIMAGHEQDALIRSVDGGLNWTSISMNAGMNEGGGTAFIFFVDTGNSTTTRSTWLYTAQGTGGVVGTWRTTNAGTSWTQVDTNEHPHGTMHIYQPDAGGVVFMGGIYSALGWGVLRSTDYGATWAIASTLNSAAVVWGTPSKVYAMYSAAINTGTVSPAWQSADLPASSGWASVSTPGGMVNGPTQIAIVTDGSRRAFFGPCWHAGLWRYIEP